VKVRYREEEEADWSEVCVVLDSVVWVDVGVRLKMCVCVCCVCVLDVCGDGGGGPAKVAHGL